MPIARNEVAQRLSAIFREVFEDETLQIHDAMTAKDVAGWDSLNHINLIVQAERSFKIKFTTKEIMTFQNVGEFVDSIHRKAAGNEGTQV